MDLNELKKLINEEVQRTKQRNLLKEGPKGGGTVGGRPANIQKQPAIAGELSRLLGELSILIPREGFNVKNFSEATKNSLLKIRNYLDNLEQESTIEQLQQIAVDIINNSHIAIEVSKISPEEFNRLHDIMLKTSNIKKELDKIKLQIPRDPVAELPTRFISGDEPTRAVSGISGGKLATDGTVIKPKPKTGTETSTETGIFSSLFKETKKP